MRIDLTNLESTAREKRSARTANIDFNLRAYKLASSVCELLGVELPANCRRVVVTIEAGQASVHFETVTMQNGIKVTSSKTEDVTHTPGVSKS